MSIAELTAAAVDLVNKYGTISAIRGQYAALVAEYGKDQFADILKRAKTMRAEEIERAAEGLNNGVFTFAAISAAVMHAVRKDTNYSALCAYARRAYDGTDAEIAAAIVKDYFSAVDDNGTPLTRCNHINAKGTEIYAVYMAKKLTHANAVSILKSSLDNMKRAAVNAATKESDNNAATRSNVRAVGAIVAVYAAALDENERATIGERRDTSKDERTKNAAAALLGKSLPIGCVSLSVWNAAANGNEDAAAAVDAARNAAKDAATKRATK